LFGFKSFFFFEEKKTVKHFFVFVFLSLNRLQQFFFFKGSFVFFSFLGFAFRFLLTTKD